MASYGFAEPQKIELACESGVKVLQNWCTCLDGLRIGQFGPDCTPTHTPSRSHTLKRFVNLEPPTMLKHSLSAISTLQEPTTKRGGLTKLTLTTLTQAQAGKDKNLVEPCEAL